MQEIATPSATAGGADRQRQGLIVMAASMGTIFEWYDFFIYGTLAATLGRLFLPPSNPTVQLLLVLASFAVGFGFRPLGAAIFGYLGDRFGRKYTFLATITLMGGATAAIGFLPVYATMGNAAPITLVFLRIVQGLALGGEYGGAAIYVAENAPPSRRGFHTSFIQMGGTAGFLLSVVVVLATQQLLTPTEWREWGWRIPFLLSLVLLVISIWIRTHLGESPVFETLRQKGEIAKNPLRDSFVRPGNAKRMILAFGVVSGPTVVWYLAQFQTLYFLQGVLRVDESRARLIAAVCAAIGLIWFPLFGLISDRIGRKKPIIVAFVLTLIVIFPFFWVLAEAGNPALARAARDAPVVVEGPSCRFNPFMLSGQKSACAQAIDHLSARGIPYKPREAQDFHILVGGMVVPDVRSDAVDHALEARGYPSAPAIPRGGSLLMIFLVLIAFGVLSAATYAPIAAILTELFPASVRYSSLSIPYHFGTGYVGGFLPFVSEYLIARSGNPFEGLWYTFVTVAISLVVVVLWLPETAGRSRRE